MLSALKRKLEDRKNRKKAVADSQHWKEDPRLRACLQAMRGSCTVVPMELHEALVAVVNIALSEDNWKELEVDDLPDGFLPETVYLLWDNEKLPVLKAPRDMAMDHLADVIAVSGQTFLIAQSMDRVVHFHQAEEKVRIYSV